MVEFSFDRDDFFDTDPRGLFDRPDIRQDMRDREQEMNLSICSLAFGYV